ATVSALYGQRSAMGEIGAAGAGQVPGTGGAAPADAADSTRRALVLGRPAQLTGEVRIVPDPRT
ncbi:MAG: hypothetical protein GWN71_16465, partial [Gammaproteobacteria bacterium]|nr:hypothetical protein [Actinomycetota bacterium]NIU75114.1 hypothetical protein [Gammaproteobacteria bacterium]NIX21069.1 hypothetical protein [Actinomycetota bacterium]